jgi:hypothetical protein
MTFDDICKIIFMFKGNPRVVLEEMKPFAGILIFNVHQKHISRFVRFPWVDVQAMGIEFKFKRRSNAWLKINSHGSQIYYSMEQK